MSDYLTLFDNLRNHTGMYLPIENYASVTGFLLGFDSARSGGVLVGFREWLVVTRGDSNNLSWEALVLRLTFPDDSSLHEAVNLPPDAQRAAINGLFDLVVKFVKEREARGLRRIYLDYEKWLRAQEWYAPSSPEWYEPSLER